MRWFFDCWIKRLDAFPVFMRVQLSSISLFSSPSRWGLGSLAREQEQLPTTIKLIPAILNTGLLTLVTRILRVSSCQKLNMTCASITIRTAPLLLLYGIISSFRQQRACTSVHSTRAHERDMCHMPCCYDIDMAKSKVRVYLHLQ